jgi:hypothetical protein
MKTLFLDAVSWDLVKDASGNIAVATDPYSLAQDAASAIRTVLGEVWYNTKLGIAWDKILGQPPNIALLKSKLQDAALTVPGVVSAVVFISSFADRNVSGQVQVTDANGVTTAATF